MLTVEKLNGFGANTEDGIGRCMGNEALYLRLAAAAADQPEFDKIRSFVSEGDLGSAFESAHALKGVLGNLSLTPLYEKVSAVTELLRSRTETDYSQALDEISSLRDELKRLSE